MSIAIEAWTLALRAGYLAYALPVFQPESIDFSDAIRKLNATLRLAQDRSGLNRYAFARSLPLSTLTLLERMGAVLDNAPDREFQPAEANLRDWSNDAEHTRRWLAMCPQRGRRSSTSLHQIDAWAHHAVSGRRSARWMLQLWRTSISALPRDFVRAESIDALAQCFSQLRNPWATTEARIGAIESILELFEIDRSWMKHQLRNRLFHSIFCWPLLVNSTSGQGYSLPVGISASFDGSKAERGLRIEGLSGSVQSADWRMRLVACVKVAKDLWRSKHGHFGKMRELVMSDRTVIAVDFRLANNVAALPATLTDSSADAYFAQSFLARLLGRSNLGSTVATGSIGAQLRDDETGSPELNYAFDPPEAIDAKLEYVFASKAFDRVVLPAGARMTATRVMRRGVDDAADDPYSTQSAECIFVSEEQGMQGMTDMMNEGTTEWRQHKYVRCPEIRALVHSDEKPSKSRCASQNASTLLSLASAIDELRCGNPIREWTQSISALAQTLRASNEILRLRITPVPPTLAWTFVRVVDYENGLSLWRTIWEALGASHESLDELLRQTSVDGVARVVAQALAVNEPSIEAPTHRAPDLLVLIDSQLLFDREASHPSPDSLPFSLKAVLDRLSASQVLKKHDGALARLLGSSRILLAKSDVASTPASLSSLDGNTRQLLIELSTFRYDFSQNMAAALLTALGVRDEAIVMRKRLHTLCRRGLLQRSQGRFFLPLTVRLGVELLQAELRESPITSSRRFLAAAQTYAPHTTRESARGLRFEASLTANCIHEARRFLDQAHEFALRSGPSRDASMLANICKDAKRKHLLFTDLQSWSALDRLLGSKNMPTYAYELAQELLRGTREDAFHPIQLLSAARAAAACARAEVDEREVARFIEEADHLFQVALSACSRHPSENWHNAVRVWCSYCAELLRKSDPSRAMAVMTRIRIELRNTDLWRNEFMMGLSSVAFEYAGDQSLPEDAIAFEFYQLACRAAPSWMQHRIRSIGVASANETVGDVDILLAELRAQPGWRVRVERAVAKLQHDMQELELSGQLIDRLRRGIAAVQARS